MKFSLLKKKVLQKISPDASEAREEKAFALKLKAVLERICADRVSFVGSAARDTGLKGDRDIDLFVQFPSHLEEEYIVKKTFDYARKHIKANWIIRYAEHPYLQAQIGNFKVEIIPCFVAKPHEGIKSAVDRSPLHMDYLQKKLSPKQREDVRVLKQFLKNSNLYGAEISVKGFSGLVCEYLVLNYRSFEGVVENAAKWRPPVRIDIEGSSKKQFSEPLVIVDAIDRNRNAAAVVSETNVARFIALCQAFSKNSSSEKFFFSQPKQKTKAEIKSAWKKRSTQIALVEFAAPELVEDILIPQLKKTQEHAFKHLVLEGYSLIDSASFVENGKGFLLFEFSWDKKPRVKKITGPPAWNEKAVSQFLKGKKALRGPFVEGSKIVEEIAGEGNALETLGELKTKAVKWGVASHLISPLRKAVVRKNEGVFEARCLKGLQDYFFKREQWW